MDEVSEVALKLKRIREESGIPVREIARHLGMPSQSSYTHYERRFKKPYLPRNIAEALADLFAGAGIARERVMRLAGESPRSPLLEAAESSEPFSTTVPVYDISAAAGVGMIVPDYEAVAENLAFPAGYLRHITSTSPQHLAIISVTGASMLPTLSHDDLVMVDMTKKNISYDGMFVVRHDDLLKVKRLRWGKGRASITVRSDNARDFPEEEVDPMDIEVVGRVIWTGKKEP